MIEVLNATTQLPKCPVPEMFFGPAITIISTVVMGWIFTTFVRKRKERPGITPIKPAASIGKKEY